MRSAGEDLRLLCCEFLLSQDPGCLELPKLLELANHVDLWRGRLRRRWRWLLVVRLLLPVGLGIRCILRLLVLLRPTIALPA
jgi:hypothetical protein